MNLSEKDIEYILKEWNVTPIEFKKAEKGNVNHNWIIKTKDAKYILRKVHNEYKQQDLEFELNYLTYLKDCNFPYEIPFPISTTSKNSFIKTKKGYFYLYKFIEGNINENQDEESLKQIALMLSKYHEILKNSNFVNNKPQIEDYNRKTLLKEFDEYEKGTEIKSEKKEIFLKELNKIIPILEKLDTKIYNSLKKYPIHRDLNPENLIWRDNKLIGVIDFDNVSHTNDALIRDIAIIMQYFCSYKRKKLDLTKAKFFIEEYKKNSQLTKEEVSIIPDIITATYIEDFGYTYWMLINDPKRAKLSRLRKYSNAAQWHFKNRNKIIGELTR